MKARDGGVWSASGMWGPYDRMESNRNQRNWNRIGNRIEANLIESAWNRIGIESNRNWIESESESHRDRNRIESNRNRIESESNRIGIESNWIGIGIGIWSKSNRVGIGIGSNSIEIKSNRNRIGIESNRNRIGNGIRIESNRYRNRKGKRNRIESNRNKSNRIWLGIGFGTASNRFEFESELHRIGIDPNQTQSNRHPPAEPSSLSHNGYIRVSCCWRAGWLLLSSG